jgi:hypothetical protein
LDDISQEAVQDALLERIGVGPAIGPIVEAASHYTTALGFSFVLGFLSTGDLAISCTPLPVLSNLKTILSDCNDSLDELESMRGLFYERLQQFLPA